MCRMAIFWDIKLKFCMWYRSAPIYSLYEFKSNRREKNHDFFTSSDCAEIWNIWLSNRVHEKTNFKKLFFQKLCDCGQLFSLFLGQFSWIFFCVQPMPKCIQIRNLSQIGPKIRKKVACNSTVFEKIFFWNFLFHVLG